MVATYLEGYGYLHPEAGFVVEVWFRHATVGSNYQAMVSQQAQAPWYRDLVNNSETGRHIWYGLTAAGALYLEMKLNNGTHVVTWTDPSPGGYASDSTWHHTAVRCAKNRKDITVYYDGYPIGDTNPEPTVVATSALDWLPGFLIFGGAYSPNTGNNGMDAWNGKLAYVAAYNRELTSAQIFEHYNAVGGTVYYGDDEVTRLERIMRWAEVPDNAFCADEPVSILQGVQTKDQTALDTAEKTTDAAWGVLFADEQGRMVYHNRRHSNNRFVFATLTESSQAAPEIGLTFTTDDLKVYNDIKGTRPQGTSAWMTDKVSKAQLGRKGWEFDIPLTRDAELTNAVAWLLARYGRDRLRVSAVTLAAESSDLIEWVATTVNLGDVLAFDELPDHAPVQYMEFVVEKIDMKIDKIDQLFSVTLELSPQEMNRTWQIGVSKLSDGDMVAF